MTPFKHFELEVVVYGNELLSCAHTRGVQKVMQLDHKEEWKCYKRHFIFQCNHRRVQCIWDIFWQTVNSTKIEFFCLSLQPLLESLLERFIVRIADTTKVRLQIAEQKIVTGSQVRTVCRVV